jgi:hypothetical protein
VAKFGVEPGELKEMLTNAKGEIAVATLKRTKDNRGQFELRPSNFRVYPDTPPSRAERSSGIALPWVTQGGKQEPGGA